VALADTRYTTGIGNIVEVADAERALAAAERDEAIARLDAWRAVVAVHRAQGDMSPLLGAMGAKG
jgi:outer membrane protein TolC